MSQQQFAVTGLFSRGGRSNWALLFQKVTQVAFEREYVNGADYRIDTELFLEILPEVPGSLSPEVIAAFEQDSKQHTRY